LHKKKLHKSVAEIKHLETKIAALEHQLEDIDDKLILA
jgi:septal ring factor EnvC (AmiA/AmiB activator)